MDGPKSPSPCPFNRGEGEGGGGVPTMTSLWRREEFLKGSLKLSSVCTVLKILVVFRQLF